MSIIYLCRIKYLLASAVLLVLVACTGSDEGTVPTPIISVEILAPVITTYHASSAVSSSSSPILFEGTALDVDGSSLSGTALVWTYTDTNTNITTQIGTGTGTDLDPIISAALPFGNHVVRLTATNDVGESNYAEKNILVNRIPLSVNLISPSPGEILNFEQDIDLNPIPIALEGTVYDPEDGFLSGAAMKWYSRSITPNSWLPFATGELTEYVFPPGLHTLWLMGTDSAGAEVGKSIRFTVIGQNGNLPPTVTITTPSPGDEFAVGEPVNLSATVTDDNDLIIPDTALIWSSNIDGYLGSGLSITCAIATPANLCDKNLSAGTHTITLTATDSGFLSGSNAVAITINGSAVDSPPTNTSVQNGFIDVSPVVTKGEALPGSVELSISATDDIGLAAYAITVVDDGSIPPVPSLTWVNISGTSYTNTFSYSLTQTYPLGSTLTFYVWFKDAAGQISSFKSDTIQLLDVVDPINTTGSNYINGGNAMTYSRNVNLSLKAEDLWGIAAYYVAEGTNPSTPDNNTAWNYVAETKIYDSVTRYTIGDVITNNVITLTVWFMDTAGRITATGVSDTITYSNFVTDVKFDSGFESSWTLTGDWTSINTPTTGPASCITNQCAGTADANYTQESDLESPAIDLPAIWETELIRLNVCHWYNFSSFTIPGHMGGTTVYDYGYFQIAQMELSGWGNWVSLQNFSGTSPNGWMELSQDLTAFAGKTVKFRYKLLPDAGSLLNQAGWYLDNLSIQLNPVAPPGNCQ